jgi:hypothetical protein
LCSHLAFLPSPIMLADLSLGYHNCATGPSAHILVKVS